jgi:hypothetical protein
MSARLQADGVTVDVERVGQLIHVRIKPTEAEPGRDAGPRTCIALTPTDAHALGVMLQQVEAANETEGD